MEQMRTRHSEPPSNLMHMLSYNNGNMWRTCLDSQDNSVNHGACPREYLIRTADSINAAFETHQMSACWTLAGGLIRRGLGPTKRRYR
eukprot:6028897-Heterocapsa_arctica.AAC.1